MRRNVQLKRTPFPQRKQGISGAQLSRFSPGAESPRTAPTIRTVAAAKRQRSTGPDQKTRNLVLERDGHACVCCGVSVIGRTCSLQHRKRRSHGVDNSPANLITVLGDGSAGCHARIDSRIDPRDEAMGYTVRSWDDPAAVPVMIHGAGGGFTAWLTADGGYSLTPPAVTL